MFFASDNGAPVAPQIMAALIAANEGPAMGYGNDPLSERAIARIREVFEAPDAAVHLVATGTAANALALATLCPPWGAVLCHADAHIQNDECGAPEFFTAGAKLVPVAGAHGRITPEALAAALDRLPRGNVHSVQPGALSLTNVTEAGTVLTPADIAALAAIARGRGLPVHLDGARLANALAATGASPADMTWRAGVDALSLGGTKNGLMGAEAVIFFDPARSTETALRRKRAGHLLSKHRYLAAQFDAWLDGGLWLDLARHANTMASRLATGLAPLPGVRLHHPVEANIVFASFPRAAHDRARAAGASYYHWPDTPDQTPGGAPAGARLVTAWSTTPVEIDRLLQLLA